MAIWDKITSRGSVEDRRGLRGAGLGLGGVAILALFTYLSGGDMGDILGQVMRTGIQNPAVDTREFEGEDSYEAFASAVLGSANDMWKEKFTGINREYREPTLVLFRGATTSACGGAESFVGPHYCPLDETIYLDETFFEELQRRFGAEGGDVAEAYVIAHEAGHHAQHLLGTISANRTNEESVGVELQADCFAGLWANSIRDIGVFEPDEIKEAIDAAAAVGDDNIQKQSGSRVNPESWTHGSSEARVTAFTKGYSAGTLEACTIVNP